MSRSPDPRSFLPLTPLVLHVLLSLAEGAKHGYGVIQDVAARTDGLIRLRTGTLYVLMQRLEDQSLIEEAVDHPRPDGDDERRRYYQVTALGRAVVRAEARRLQGVLGDAKRARLLGRTERG